jgi:hypothetical protein
MVCQKETRAAAAPTRIAFGSQAVRAEIRRFVLPHHTLQQVEVVQSVRSLIGDHGPFVRWTFVSGTTRAFKIGEEIVVEIPKAQANRTENL